MRNYTDYKLNEGIFLAATIAKVVLLLSQALALGVIAAATYGIYKLIQKQVELTAKLNRLIEYEKNGVNVGQNVEQLREQIAETVKERIELNTKFDKDKEMVENRLNKLSADARKRINKKVTKIHAKLLPPMVKKKRG